MKVDRKALEEMIDPHVTFAYESLVKWTKDKIQMSTVTGDHSVLVKSTVNDEAGFGWSGMTVFGIDPTSFHKKAKTMDKDVIDVDVDKGVIHFDGGNIEQRESVYNTELISTLEMPNFDFKSKVTVDGERFAKIFKAATSIQTDMKLEPPSIFLTINEDGFRIYAARFDRDEVEQVFEPSDTDMFEYAGPATSKFRLRLIRPFVNKAKGKAVTVHLCPEDDRPVKITTPIRHGEAMIFVAPLISGSETEVKS